MFFFLFYFHIFKENLLALLSEENEDTPPEETHPEGNEETPLEGNEDNEENEESPPQPKTQSKKKSIFLTSLFLLFFSGGERKR